MRKLILFVAALLATVVLPACTSNGETIGYYLQKAGILGEHELRHPAGSAALSGNFFILSGDLKTVNVIEFSWSPEKNRIISSEFSKNMFEIEIDEKKSVPTIEFIFDEKLLSTKEIFLDSIRKLTAINTNTILGSVAGNIEVIRVRISAESLKNEPALPQL